MHRIGDACIALGMHASQARGHHPPMHPREAPPLHPAAEALEQCAAEALEHLWGSLAGTRGLGSRLEKTHLPTHHQTTHHQPTHHQRSPVTHLKEVLRAGHMKQSRTHEAGSPAVAAGTSAPPHTGSPVIWVARDLGRP